MYTAVEISPRGGAQKVAQSQRRGRERARARAGISPASILKSPRTRKTLLPLRSHSRGVRGLRPRPLTRPPPPRPPPLTQGLRPRSTPSLLAGPSAPLNLLPLHGAFGPAHFPPVTRGLRPRPPRPRARLASLAFCKEPAATGNCGKVRERFPRQPPSPFSFSFLFLFPSPFLSFLFLIFEDPFLNPEIFLLNPS